MYSDKKIRGLIIEDDEILRKGLLQMLQVYAPQIEIVGEADTVDTALNQLIQNQPDVVFLDIMLIGGTGFDVLEQYQAKMGKPNFQIVFLTAFEEYAIKAFRMSALDYLLKPIDPDELKAVLAKLYKPKNQNQELLELLNIQLNKTNVTKKIALHTAEDIHVVLVHDIVYCQSDNNYTFIYLKNNKKILVSKPLKEYDDLITDEGFLRIHQSYLINQNEIQSFNKSQQTVTLCNGIVLPVSSRKKEMVINHIKQITKE